MEQKKKKLRTAVNYSKNTYVGETGVGCNTGLVVTEAVL